MNKLGKRILVAVGQLLVVGLIAVAITAIANADPVGADPNASTAQGTSPGSGVNNPGAPSNTCANGDCGQPNNQKSISAPTACTTYDYNGSLNTTCGPKATVLGDKKNSGGSDPSTAPDTK